MRTGSPLEAALEHCIGVREYPYLLYDRPLHHGGALQLQADDVARAIHLYCCQGRAWPNHLLPGHLVGHKLEISIYVQVVLPQVDKEALKQGGHMFGSPIGGASSPGRGSLCQLSGPCLQSGNHSYAMW